MTSPSSGAASAASDDPGPWRVPVEPEHYIPVARGPLVEALAGQIFGGDHAARGFRELAAFLAAVYHHHYHELQERLADCYALFDDGNTEVGREVPPPDQLAEAELRFVEDLIRVLRRANFVPLTQRDIEVAEAVDFAFNLPVEIDWDALDADLLTRYFDRHSYDPEGGAAPGFARRILVYRRGTGVETLEGRLLLQKLDVLVGRLLGAVLGLFGRGETAAPRSEPRPAERHSMRATRYVERRTLRREPLGPRDFFKVATLQEPTFRQLILVYRPAAREEDGPGPRPIRIKVFRDIPMADLEVVFPEKKLSMKPVDLIKLVATAVSGVVIVAFKLLSKAAINPFLALVSAVSLCGYALKTFFGYKQSKDRYQQLVTRSLYDKSLDNDRGVLFTLIDALEQQEVKEALLAYFYLWQNGPKTEAELDAIAERFLADFFDVEVDFEADDALDKLIELGLVEVAGELLPAVRDGEREVIYRAVPLHAALRKLDERWDDLYCYQDAAAGMAAGMDAPPATATGAPDRSAGAISDQPTRASGASYLDEPLG